MKVDTKNIIFKLNNHNDNEYSIRCFLSIPEQEKKALLGYINFSIKRNKAWIHRVSVKENHRRLGIGSSLLSEMENFLKSKNASGEENVNIIEGKFYPLGVSEQSLRNFYEKNGYNVPNKSHTWDDYDETWTLSKILTNQHVKSHDEDFSQTLNIKK